jgi:hypothetical protein
MNGVVFVFRKGKASVGHEVPLLQQGCATRRKNVFEAAMPGKFLSIGYLNGLAGAFP